MEVQKQIRLYLKGILKSCVAVIIFTTPTSTRFMNIFTKSN